MNKTELIDSVTQSIGSTKAETTRIIDSTIHSIVEELTKGGQVTLPGFGTLSVANQAARMGRNIRTGEPIEISARRVPKFKAAKALKEAVQNEE